MDAGFAAVPKPALVPVGTGSPEVESQRQATMKAVAASAVSGKATTATLPCWEDTSFRRDGLIKYVSMEWNYPGDRQYELRARSSWVGPWELFTVCRDPFSKLTTIKSQSNNKYVSVEMGYQGTIYAMLRARTSEDSLIDSWELFYTEFEPREGYCGQIRAKSNGLFVAVEEGYTGESQGMLRARTPRSQIGTWETFCY
ncbi:hypothetical protein AB0M95_07505 [Sphaerisporangium sp. NPDC051017]|uniref:fascin domain-containing protein n=1 Tax=Sphaerisporangium sp. NPDC051017 TaxID=3154636 RepID=UPI0034261690